MIGKLGVWRRSSTVLCLGFFASLAARGALAADCPGHPDAIVGGITPNAPVADTVALLDAQMASARFRGIRPMGEGAPVPRPEILRALQERNLVFDFISQSIGSGGIATIHRK